jgi:glycosyltransferase involved in cell wall biosynthesis
MSIPSEAVWLDARATQSVRHPERGIARFVTEHIGALLEVAPDATGAIGIDPELPLPAALERLSGSGLLRSHDSGGAGETPAIYHVTSPFEATLDFERVWPRWARNGDVRTVVTLYDLIPLVLRDTYFGLAGWGHLATAWMARLGLIRAADQVLTISHRTAADAIERLGIPEERITVIECGVSGELSSLVAPGAETESALRGVSSRIRSGYLLYVGGDEPRKNLEGTIRAYALLPERLRAAHQLVITCKLPLIRRAQLQRFARSLGIARRQLVLTGFVSDRELAALYRDCGLFVFSSLYEGAGLPILEAMSCGAPVAASNTSSIPELLGDSGATFDPANPAEIARTLAAVLKDPGRLEALRERSRRQAALFTWERVAERTLEGYERAPKAKRAAP